MSDDFRKILLVPESTRLPDEFEPGTLKRQRITLGLRRLLLLRRGHGPTRERKRASEGEV